MKLFMNVLPVPMVVSGIADCGYYLNSRFEEPAVVLSKDSS